MFSKVGGTGPLSIFGELVSRMILSVKVTKDNSQEVRISPHHTHYPVGGHELFLLHESLQENANTDQNE